MSPAPEPAPAAGAPAPQRDPEAIAALRRMGEFLRAQQRFTVLGESSTDEVLTSGQKIQLDSTVNLKVRRPDRFRIDIDSDRKQREIYYDGSTFTLFGERVGYFAQVPAPPTIRETIEHAQAHFGINLPLVDLFYWGTDAGDELAITAATAIGPSHVKGIDVDHYAFREPDVDYQLWIEKGAKPLPHKLVITTTTEPSQPQYTAVFTWDLDPELDDAEFTFEPPPGARRIVFEEARP